MKKVIVCLIILIAVGVICSQANADPVKIYWSSRVDDSNGIFRAD